MSEVRHIANDLWRDRATNQFPLWRRRPAAGSSDGGPLYGRSLSLINTIRHAVRSRIDRSGDNAKEALAQLSDASLTIEIGARMREVRRSDRSFASLKTFVAAVCEAAVREKVLSGYDDYTVWGATYMLLGRNVSIPGEDARLDALAIAVCAAALLNERIHVVSDEAKRSQQLYERFEPLYRRLRLSVGLAAAVSSAEKRRNEYGAQIVHIDAATMAADYLTDLELTRVDGLSLRAAINLLAGRENEKGRIILNNASWLFADQGDLVLGVGSMRTATIAGDQEFFEESQFAAEAIEFARLFQVGDDFVVSDGAPVLTKSGHEKAAGAAVSFSPLWNGERRRSRSLTLALTVLHCYRSGVDYQIESGRIKPLNSELIAAMNDDENGDLSIEKLLLAKEDKQASIEKRVRRRASVKSVLPRYNRISSVSCPGAGMAGELWTTFRLQTVGLSVFPSGKTLVKAAVVSPNEARAMLERAVATAESGDTKQVLLITQPGADLSATIDSSAEGGVAQRVTHLPFDEAAHERLASFAEPVTAIVAYAGDRDETWRRMIDALCARKEPTRIRLLLANDDPVFEFLPDGLRSSSVQRFAQKYRFIARLYCQAALQARRARFAKYRRAQGAYERTMRRVLAFAGGA